MKKRIFAFLYALTLLISVMPSAFADTYNNGAFVGNYLSAGATPSNYGELNILTCTDSSITVNFKFIKNDNQQLIYACSEGKMTDTKGTVPFTVYYADGRFVANGIMNITLTDYCVKVSCDSDKQHLFDGIMKPQFTLNPYGTPSSTPNTPPTNMSSDVSVVLNGSKVSFPKGINPVIINDSTYVPLRSVFDKMGINVYWDEYKVNDILNAQSITCTKNDTIVQFTRTLNETGTNAWTLTKWVGENTDSANNTKINITELQPTIIGESSYIPLRVVSEAFSADVGWLDAQRTVEINCDTANTYKYDSELIGKIEDFTQEMATKYITADYTSIVAYPTPYFSPQAKFYNYSAHDRWNEVIIHIFYGGFVEVEPINITGIDEKAVLPTPTQTPTTSDDTTVLPDEDTTVNNDAIDNSTSETSDDDYYDTINDGPEK